MKRIHKAKRAVGLRSTTRATALVAFIAAALAVVFWPVAASGLPTSIRAASVVAAEPDHVTLNVQGCNNDGTITLPNGNGDFICPDTEYAPGNLGKGWNELDLVPFRLTAKAGNSAPGTQTYTTGVAFDAEDAGAPGFDVISQLVLNTALSSASCVLGGQSAQTNIIPGFGGIDRSIGRTVTITQPASTTCVFDYYGRLALGSHLFPGASLHGNLSDGTFSGTNQDRSIPVNEIAPQELSKDMSASQGSDHIWDVTKGATPAEVPFANTCDPSASRSAAVSILVTWTKQAATPSGPITVITHVYATNPAARAITINLTDDIRSGTTVLSTATAGPTLLPANTTTPVLTHTTEVPAGTTDLNDVATGTYTDQVTGIPIPGTTTASASATVQLSGVETNQTATVNDLESISGAGFSYSADGFSGASGGFDNGYVAGTKTTSGVSWTSDSQSSSGSVTLSKSIYVDEGTAGTGSLDDTATLTGSDGASASANASVSISASATVSLTIHKTTTTAVDTAGGDTFNFQVLDGATLVASPSVTIAQGGTSGDVTVSGLTPGVQYTIHELAGSNPAWDLAPDSTDTISLPQCSDTINIENGFGPASAQVKKVTDPAGSEAGWQMTLTGPGGPETVTTTGTGFTAFATTLQEGSYTITETAQSGWDQTGSTGCSFTVNYPADNDRVFSCTLTNRQRGAIIIRKITNPNPDPSDTSFPFTAGGGLSPSTFSLKNGESRTYSNVVPGSGYSAAESVPSGWDLTSSTCSDGSPVSNIAVSPGETVTCTFTNRQRGKARVVKTQSGAALTGTQAFTFQLRTGASASAAGTILESGTANAGNGGVIAFSTFLVPGATYQLCEQMQPGWMTTLGPPFYSVYNPSGDNSVVCTDFSVTAGQTRTFTIDNQPPPGGLALTIGYWKNWSSCTGGGQKPVLDQTLRTLANAGHPATLGLLVLDPGTLGVATACSYAVNILSKQTLTGKKMSSDPLFNMAAQLLAADLNVGSGAGVCASAITAINQAHALLTKYKFDGNGYTPKLTAADAALANSLATTLDKYNNNKLC